jgi:hypothetical protein
MTEPTVHMTSTIAWLPLVFGGLPHTDVMEAWDALLSRFPEIPCWPRLPRKSYLENMYTQYSERFPGVSLDDGAIYVDRRKDIDRGIEVLYLAYLEDDLAYGRISGAYAAGLDALRRGDVALPHKPVAIRGEITGPVSWGLTIVDENRRPILYDRVMEDAVAKHLRLKAAWQEEALRRFSPNTIMIVNEPYMASFGSSSVALSKEHTIELFEDVFAGLQGLKGIYCSGTTDWSVLANTSADLLCFDAYDYVQSLTDYAEELGAFVARGGILVWGIVPAGAPARSETVESLVARLEDAMDLLAEAGVPREQLEAQGMVSPSTSLGALRVPLAEHVLDLTEAVSAAMRARYGASTHPPEQSSQQQRKREE